MTHQNNVSNKTNIDERISQLPPVLFKDYSCKVYQVPITQDTRQAIKQLISEVVDEVIGEKKTKNAEEDQSVADSVYYEQQHNIGYNQAIDDMHQRKEELL